MIRGIRLKASPTAAQKQTLSQWMGCVRYIWNAKTREEKEIRKELNSKETQKYPEINSCYAHLKSKEETPWLFECPSVILRNSISNWYTTYQNFFKKRCGRPQHKKKDGRGSIHLTRELFSFQKGEDGVSRLFIGNKKHNLGHLTIKSHRAYKPPNSIYIKKKHHTYWVSFCYEDDRISNEVKTQKQHLKDLSTKETKYLMDNLVGIDRGIARPVQTSLGEECYYDLDNSEKASKAYLEKRRRYYQKKLSRQKKGSNRRYKTKVRLSQKHSRIANIRDNFCHQISRKLVDNPNTKGIIFENLGIKRMTKRSKKKQDANGKYLPNRAKAKAGLNKSILDKDWYKLELYTKYKSHQAGKAFFKVAPNHTSQECANCHHIHPDNRKKQKEFSCLDCGHTDNADFNASKVIKWRAIQLLKNSGTELSKGEVLSPKDIGRGADIRRKKAMVPACAAA